MNQIVKKKNVEGRESTRDHLFSDQTLPDVCCTASSVRLVTCSVSLRPRAFLLHEKKIRRLSEHLLEVRTRRDV